MELGTLDVYFGAMIKGVPLLLVIVGLVEYLKRLNVKGNPLLFASMGIGLLFGVGYMVTQTRPPEADAWLVYVYWFGNVVYGIGLGVVASGLFDVVKNVLRKPGPQ